jgi:AcrR family transcriptional regulator
LLDAAIWTFARKGYRRAAISDIIARAGVARGTFYLYFPGKESIFLAILDDFHERLHRMLQAPEPPVPLAEHNGRAMLQRTLRRWLQQFAAHRDAAVVVLKEATSIDPRFEAGALRIRELGLAYFAERFRRCQRRGLMSDTVPADVLAQLQMGMIDAAVSGYVLGAVSTDVDALARQLAMFAWNGLRPPSAHDAASAGV